MKVFLVLLLSIFLLNFAQGEMLRDRFVWIFGFDFEKDEDIQKIKGILDDAKRNGYNGAVLSAGLDSLCMKSEKYFKNLKEIKFLILFHHT